MTRYYVEVHYRMNDATREELDQHSDELMDALDEEPNLVDPDVGVNFTQRTVDVCTMVDAAADDEAGALNTALTAVRSAVHHVGAATPGWERTLEQLLSSVRLADMVDV